jgi:hypothetical protein
MKFIKAFIALAAFAAIFVVPSIASATSPEIGETTANGVTHTLNLHEKILATNVAHANTPLTTVLKSNLGNVECETATITGTLTKNGGGIEGTIETAEFLGNPDEPTPHGAHCKGGFGGKTTVTPSHTSALGIPWCIKATAEDKFEVRGGACGAATVALKFALHTATLGTCSYERSVATGPVRGTYTTHPADAIVTIEGANAKFTKTAGSVFCPSTGELFMAFTLTTDLEGISGPPLEIT